MTNAKIAAKGKPAPKPTPAPVQPVQPVQAPTSAELDAQCIKCDQLIDSLESQMSDVEIQHTEHTQAIEEMKTQQESRHQRYDELREAIAEQASRVQSLTMSLAVTAGTPSEITTQSMLDEAQAQLDAHRRDLATLEQADLKKGESDAKSQAAHERELEKLETQYQALESQVAELKTQHETLFERLGQQIYREYNKTAEELIWKLETEDAERRGRVEAYQLAIAGLRQEALQDLEDWPHISWRVQAEQKAVDAQRVDERHERQPLVALLRAHQAFLKALQQHGRSCSQRRFGNFDIVRDLAVTQQLIADCLVKEIDFKQTLETDDRIIREYT